MCGAATPDATPTDCEPSPQSSVTVPEMSVVARDTQSAVSGSIPAGLGYLSVYATASHLIGPPPTGVGLCDISGTGMSQQEVDDFIFSTYTARATYTNATPTLAIGGDNATPSGLYQAMVPPTTALEAVFDLVNDPAAEGFHRWSITYTP